MFLWFSYILKNHWWSSLVTKTFWYRKTQHILLERLTQLFFGNSLTSWCFTILEDKIQMASPPKRGRPRREQSMKVIYWGSQHLIVGKLLSDEEDRPHSNDDLASSLIELYKCSAVPAHGRLSGRSAPEACSWFCTFTSTMSRDRWREDGNRQWESRCCSYTINKIKNV